MERAYSVQFLAVRAFTQQNVRVWFSCQPKERLNRELADVSRALLRLRRSAAGVEIEEPGKVGLQGCPNGAAGRTDRRTRSGTHICSCAAADADARKATPSVKQPGSSDQSNTMRTRSMCKPRILDDLPPEVLSLVLSQLLPQDMLVQRCSRRWRDADLDASYWKPLFLNTFGEAAQTTTTKRRKAPSSEWRDRYERAWRLRVDVSCEPGTGALGLHLGRFVSSYDHRVRPTNVFHAIDGQGVLSVPDVRGKELELRYYIHDEGIPVGAFEVDLDIWLHPDPDPEGYDDAPEATSDTESRWIDAGILKGLVVYNPLGILYDPARPAVGRRGIRVGSPLRHLLEAYGVDLEDVDAYGDSRCGSQFGLRSVRYIQFGLADSDEYTLWDQWEELMDGSVTIYGGEPPQQREVPRETLLNWPLQSLQVWSDDAF